MKDKSYKKLGIFFGIILLAVILDRLSKVWVTANMNPGDIISFIPGIMQLTYVANTGAAFSFGSGSTWVFVLISIVVIATILTFVIKNICGKNDLSLPFIVSLAAVVGGGIGNLIDRVFMGAVCDFFATTFIDFAIFNVADIFVTLGGIASVILYLIYDRRSSSC